MNKKIEENIFHFISNQKLLQKGDKLLIALSGGPDSVFALNFFQKFKTKFSISLTAIHINHSLRGVESDGDELFCKELCNKLDVHFHSVKVDVNEYAKVHKQSTEEAARNLRYSKISEYAEIINANKIVTAHNLDDNSETVLLNLFRGTGLKGASGIPIKRGKIIRPFLTTSKIDILNYLDKNEIEFRIDNTNNENDFSRNYLRNEIIPLLKEKLNPKLDKSIFRFSEIARAASENLTFYAQEEFPKFIKKSESGIKISNQIVNEEYKNRVSQLLKLGIEKHFQKTFTFEDFAKLTNLFALQVGSRIELSNSIIAIKERDHIFVDFRKEEIKNQAFELQLNHDVKIGEKVISASIVEKKEVKYSSSSDLEFIDADNLIFPLIIRRWKNGDSFHPIGMNGRKNISDFLTDLRVEAKRKKEQLVLLSGSKIIWVVGERIDDSVKIKNNTKRILKLWIK